MDSHLLRKPLTRKELAKLRQFCEDTPEAMPFAEVFGLLCGIGVAPTTIMPSLWQPVAFGDHVWESQEQAEQVFGWLMRFYNQILSDLNAGRWIHPRVVLSDFGDDPRAWCRGFLTAHGMDEAWIDAERFQPMMEPIPAWAEEGELDEIPETAECLAVLTDYLRVHSEHWTAWRRRQTRPPVAAAMPKIGRNEACPCGSGRKYKRCCGRP